MGVKIVAWISWKSVFGGGPATTGSPLASRPSPLPAQADNASVAASSKSPLTRMGLFFDSGMSAVPDCVDTCLEYRATENRFRRVGKNDCKLGLDCGAVRTADFFPKP